MKHLVTGGAGFIGRWLAKVLLERGDSVVSFDNYSNSHPRNLAEFQSNPRLACVEGSVTHVDAMRALWNAHGPFDGVFHLAASIRVQDSIDDPRTTFHNDVTGTFEVLEACRRQYLESNGLKPGAPFHLHAVESQLKVKAPRVLVMSTCMVYARAGGAQAISETHPTNPASPYAASKIAAENLALSYQRSYGLPVKVVRPFNTYGPFQKRNMEGGVVAIFIARDLQGQALLVKGDGAQTRDLLFVEDCACFVAAAGLSEKCDGEILNAGLGQDIAVKELARVIADQKNGGSGVPIEHVVHDHPQAEIAKLLCDNSKAAQMLGWRPAVSLEEGIRRTREWIRANPGAL
ncbi:MAG TPA: GDP-mannose 4,6-dehydratase [Planctomycetota bacterium]|nr:GDP-mannose 4,6-dehydratase [Planctomycetota bacterium]